MCSAPLPDSTVGGAGTARADVSTGVKVPFAGCDRPATPPQEPATASSVHATGAPAGSPSNVCGAAASGRSRDTDPTVSRQPAAPAGADDGTFTVAVVPPTARDGFQGAVIGTPVPVVGGDDSEPVGDASTAVRLSG